jgi:hypothetical protein
MRKIRRMLIRTVWFVPSVSIARFIVPPLVVLHNDGIATQRKRLPENETCLMIWSHGQLRPIDHVALVIVVLLSRLCHVEGQSYLNMTGINEIGRGTLRLLRRSGYLLYYLCCTRVCPIRTT